jgi:hypothetical protein
VEAAAAQQRATPQQRQMSTPPLQQSVLCRSYWCALQWSSRKHDLSQYHDSKNMPSLFRVMQEGQQHLCKCASKQRPLPAAALGFAECRDQN